MTQCFVRLRLNYYELPDMRDATIYSDTCTALRCAFCYLKQFGTNIDISKQFVVHFKLTQVCNVTQIMIVSKYVGHFHICLYTFFSILSLNSGGCSLYQRVIFMIYFQITYAIFDNRTYSSCTCCVRIY